MEIWDPNTLLMAPGVLFCFLILIKTGLLTDWFLCQLGNCHIKSSHIRDSAVTDPFNNQAQQCQRSSWEIGFTLFFAEESAFFYLLWVSERSWPAVRRSEVDNKDQLPQSCIMLRSTLVLKLNFESQGTSAGNPRSGFIIPKLSIKHPIRVMWWESLWPASSQIKHQRWSWQNSNVYLCSY